jgi:RNA polymerase sigma factor (TIGR02999 family)
MAQNEEMTRSAGPDTIANLMAAFRAGDANAAGRLIELLYPEIKRIAARQMQQEWGDHSWQPTLLVNELYLEVQKIKSLPARDSGQENSKAAFLALAGQVMKRLLIHHARPLSKKAIKVPVDEELPYAEETSILEIDDVLSRLAAVKPAMRAVVEMKVFEGMTAEEIAGRLGCATVTVNRYWQFARRMLREELQH